MKKFNKCIFKSLGNLSPVCTVIGARLQLEPVNTELRSLHSSQLILILILILHNSDALLLQPAGTTSSALHCGYNVFCTTTGYNTLDACVLPSIVTMLQCGLYYYRPQYILHCIVVTMWFGLSPRGKLPLHCSWQVERKGATISILNSSLR